MILRVLGFLCDGVRSQLDCFRHRSWHSRPLTKCWERFETLAISLKRRGVCGPRSDRATPGGSVIFGGHYRNAWRGPRDLARVTVDSQFLHSAAESAGVEL